MTRGFLNPKQSDYAGHYRLAARTFLVGVVSLILGFWFENEVLQTLLVSGGIGLTIGSGAVALATRRRKRRADLMRDR